MQYVCVHACMYWYLTNEQQQHSWHVSFSEGRSDLLTPAPGLVSLGRKVMGIFLFSVGWWAKAFSYPMKKQLTAVVSGFPPLRCISWRACLLPAVAGVLLGWAHRCSWLGSRRLCHGCKGGWATWSCWKGTWAFNCWEKRMIRSMWKKFIFFKTEQNWRLERWKVGGTMCRERMREN